MKAIAIRFAVLILSVSLPAGCLRFGAPTAGGRPVRQVYDEAGRPEGRHEITLRAEAEPGGGPRTRPVIYPPVVFAVWIQEHLDPRRDIKVGAHWVHFKLRDSSWFPEEIDREPFAGEDAGESDLAPLREAIEASALREIIVPYRPSPAKTAPRPEETHDARNP